MIRVHPEEPVRTLQHIKTGEQKGQEEEKEDKAKEADGVRLHISLDFPIYTHVSCHSFERAKNRPANRVKYVSRSRSVGRHEIS